MAGARGCAAGPGPHGVRPLWKGRKSAFSAVGKITPTYYVQDGVVPRSSLPSVLARLNGSAGSTACRWPMFSTPETATCIR